jgi:hypothetical protein
VERASYDIALRRGRPEFIVRISRLADIENRNVVPSLHKLYSIAAIYHLDPVIISGWYEAPLEQTLVDAASLPAPKTDLGERAIQAREPGKANRPEGTTLLSDLPGSAGEFPGLERLPVGPYRYGYIGKSDRRMGPVLRPGSIVLVDTARRDIEDGEWSNEYDRPLYFVEIRGGYRCGWFQKERSKLTMQPHVLSGCVVEAWRTPDEAEVAGKVVGVIMYLNEPWSSRAVIRTERLDSNCREL